jgi:hypothetical protein
MATMNFSIPQDVKEAFDRAYAGKNKSAVLTDLVRKAIEEVDLQAVRLRVLAEVDARRPLHPKITNEQIRRARVAGRK